MANRVIVHFGVPKTGSSSIQEALFGHLKDDRFCYLNLGRANLNEAMFLGFAEDPLRYQLIRRKEPSPEQLAQERQRVHALLAAELARCGERTAILSSEAIYGLRGPEVEALVQLLRQHSSDVRAVGYLRRPAEFIASSFQQLLKLHDIASIDIDRCFPRYQRQIDKFDEVFGSDKVTCWLFDRQAFPEGCVVRDFCGRLGIHPEGARPTRRNDSLSLPAVGLLYTYRKFGPGYGAGVAAIRENRLLVARLQTLAGPRFEFHGALLRPAFLKERDSLVWMESRLGVALRKSWRDHGAEAVRSEAELLKVPAPAWDWLHAQLGHDARLSSTPPEDPRQVAAAVHALRTRLAAEHRDIGSIHA